MEKPKNGNTKIVLWIVGIVLTVGFPTLIGYVVANDRLRATEDIRVSKETDKKIEKVEVRVIKRMDDFQREQTIIGKTVARIEAKM